MINLSLVIKNVNEQTQSISNVHQMIKHKCA